MKQVPHPCFGRQAVPFGRLSEWNLSAHPDAPRIALRPVGDWDYIAELWNSRVVLAKAVRMQERGEHPKRPIRPVVPLTAGEGY